MNLHLFATIGRVAAMLLPMCLPGLALKTMATLTLMGKPPAHLTEVAMIFMVLPAKSTTSKAKRVRATLHCKSA